ALKAVSTKSPLSVSYDFNSSSKTSPNNTSKTEMSTSSIISSSKIGLSNKSRLPISILPNDPKEK
ncbi:17696_t:CDS:1, partial [Cetraspora pellucida]